MQLNFPLKHDGILDGVPDSGCSAQGERSGDGQDDGGDGEYLFHGESSFKEISQTTVCDIPKDYLILFKV